MQSSIPTAMDPPMLRVTSTTNKPPAKIHSYNNVGDVSKAADAEREDTEVN